MMTLQFLALFALVVAANAAGDLKGYQRPHRYGDCNGHDVKHITKTKLEVCAKECSKRADCKTLLFVDRGANSYCWLKNYDCPKLTATNHKEYHFYNKCNKPVCISTREKCFGKRENKYTTMANGCLSCRSVCRPFKYSERHGDCVGHDIKKIEHAKLDVCKKKCNKNAACKTLLWVDHGANSYCWLKNHTCPTLTATNHKEYHFFNKKA